MSDTESPVSKLSLNEIVTMLNQVSALRPGEKLYTKDKRIDSIQHSYYGQSVVRTLTAGASRDETHDALTELMSTSSTLLNDLFAEIKENAFADTDVDTEDDKQDQDRFSKIQTVLKNLNMLKGSMIRACDGINILKQTYDDSNATTKLTTVVTGLQSAVDANDSQFARLLSSEYRRRSRLVYVELKPAPKPSPKMPDRIITSSVPISKLPLDHSSLPSRSPLVDQKKNDVRDAASSVAMAPVQMKMKDLSRLDLSKSNIFGNAGQHDEYISE